MVFHFNCTNLFRSSHQCSSVDTYRPIDQASLHCDKTYYRVATPLLWDPGMIPPRHKMAAGVRAWFSIDTRFYRMEPCIGSKAPTDLRRTVYSVLRCTSSTDSFETVLNSLLGCFGKDTTERQGKRLELGMKPSLAPKGLLRNGKFETLGETRICNTHALFVLSMILSSSAGIYLVVIFVRIKQWGFLNFRNFLKLRTSSEPVTSFAPCFTHFYYFKC